VNVFKNKPIEVLLWSLALPGFGQLINRKYVKGILLVFLEFVINVQARLNIGIVHSFKGEMVQAIAAVDYQWLMFYPCVYVFGKWDAYRDAIINNGDKPTYYQSLPFVFSAYFSTIGVIYSDVIILNILWGPVFLPILTMIMGYLVGYALWRLLVL